ncbi:hypothetical protein FHS94_003898 [Sphingomonas aerophila]|jgi:hypothetical protein|uniref:Uncharacterized protein n=2 Tax=Sphingomonas aerophila TaxID=1344948 RepID=A0A7W9BGW9_9SPHN|nr:hypothetical protein [Sphingomonas aerophila]
MNAALYYHGTGSPKDTITDAQSIVMAQRWIALDWVRVVGAAAAFVAPPRVLTAPWSQDTAPADPLVVRVVLALVLAGVATFVVWFVTNLAAIGRFRLCPSGSSACGWGTA